MQADVSRALREEQRRDRTERGAIGRRQRSLVTLRRGKYSRHRLARPGDTDVAVDATLRAAASRAGRSRSGVAVTPEDLRRRIREHRVPFEICFVVDNSYSLHADRLVERVKGVVLRLLEDASVRGDRVSLVAFKPGVAEATVALRPTSSRTLARRRLRQVPLSGRTPLAHAVSCAGRLLRQEHAHRPNARPVVVVVTDGLPNVPLHPGRDAVEDTLLGARALRRAGVLTVVVDAAAANTGRPSCAPRLAEDAGGVYLRLDDLSPDRLADLLEGET